MTDSMKFGPEWLRNMSADTASSNSMNTSAGGQINSASIFASGNSGGGSEGTSGNNSNNSNNSSHLISSNLHNNVNTTNSAASRNTFPEFRYGREEMLLLFDRNCCLPEILTSYKKLFVERVQFPLALVPSSDEEMMQPSAPPTQRPGWLQRSPVGFSTPARGTGRVGSMERGRMRGKSIYHPAFQRPNAMFDEDQRSSAIKTERSWTERNGGATGDSSVPGSSVVVGSGGGGLNSDAWNGNTPVSSPRREFSNHPRNMENWRRSRNEDGGSSGGGDTSTTSTGTTFSAEGGWRMNTSGFQNSHTRWVRSTSWRDDELANNNENSIIGSGAGGGGGLMMLRSNSTICTSQGGERVDPTVNVAAKTAQGSVQRSISVTSSSTRNTGNGNIWPNCHQTVGTMSNIPGGGVGAEGNINDEMPLPEWAMENPSDIGGTFDASGAFHGAVDDVDDQQHTSNVTEKPINEKDLSDQLSGSEEKCSSLADEQEKLSKTMDDNSNKSANKSRDSLTHTPSPTPPSDANVDNSVENIKTKQINNHTNSTEQQTQQESVSVDQKNVENHLIENDFRKDSPTSSHTNLHNYSIHATNNDANITSNNSGDYAERMMKVTDDMIEKLIMDDEDSKEEHMKSGILTGGVSKRNAPQHVFITALQPQQQNPNHPVTVSPALSSAAGVGPTVPPNMSLYNMGVMVDHPHNMTALHQFQQQQMTANAIGLQTPAPQPPHPMASSAPTDLWLYRDPQAKVQGPFSAIEMTEWYRAGYFNENLFVRRVCDARFRPLGDLIKICNGQMPFSHSHLIPIDINPTALTPPLVPVLTAKPSAQATSDYVMKGLIEHQQHQQHQQQHEKLKGSVTAAADTLSNALKLSSVDISQVLNMHFQRLQDRFINNHEMEIINELSKNECFRRLTAAEQDTVVRQKLQRMVMPEYLTNLDGLSNSLAALNPTAGTQLYDTIAECTKKEQLFSNHQGGQPQSQAQPTQSTQQQQQQRSAAYINNEDFLMKGKSCSGHDLNSTDLLNEFNLRMFINNGASNAVTGVGNGDGTVVATQNAHGHEFLSDQQLFGAATGTATSNQQNNTSQSPMMQMWMNSLAAVNQTSTHPLINVTAQQSAPSGVNNQWLNGPLVGIPTINLAREQHVIGGGTGSNIMSSPKPTPASMWDVATLEHVQVQQQQHQQQHEQQLQQQMQHQQHQQQTYEHNTRHLKNSEKHTQQDHQQQQLQEQDINKHTNNKQQQQQSEEIKPAQQQKTANDIQKSNNDAVALKSSNSNNDNNNKQPGNQLQQRVSEKSQTHVNNNNNKRTSTNNNNGVKSLNKNNKTDNNFVEQLSKKSEEERRREQNEEKRRQKEERKRQQMEEEKRRLIQAEEEKRRQLQEEEKRQQQIQAQRRKALMSSNSTINNSSGNNNNTNSNLLTSPNSANNVGNQKSKEQQQRIQSSVAPWSTQSMASKSQGPGLAEIQKAERRERRADQQRQLEIQEKQMRALAAAAEAQDTVLKWNAAPVQVKSFAEIQAEEAKRLAHEQMELQRRKEQEVQNNLIAFSSAGNSGTGGLNTSSNISSIWSGNKIWGSAANTAGFWEESLKYNNNNKSINACLSSINTTVNNISNLTAASVVSQSLVQQKPITAQMQHQSSSTTQQQQSSINKNIKKSQSVAVMQNNASASTGSTSAGFNAQKKSFNNAATAATNKQTNKSQKVDNNSGAASSNVGANGSNDKKPSIAKNSNNNAAANKGDDYEAEFTNWCTKSLNNMNTKVDVPTFVSFLRDLESPYEVKDYIRMYLGESKEYIDFAKQFLERRSRYKNLQRAQNAHDDDLCKPAQAITPSVNDNTENKGKQKKVKKNKMTKLDARILGFSVTAAEGRINVGDRDYGDAP